MEQLYTMQNIPKRMLIYTLNLNTDFGIVSPNVKDLYAKGESHENFDLIF